MLLYLFDFRKVFFEGASKSSTAFFYSVVLIFVLSRRVNLGRLCFKYSYISLAWRGGGGGGGCKREKGGFFSIIYHAEKTRAPEACNVYTEGVVLCYFVRGKNISI